MKNFSTVNIEPKLRVRDARPHFNAFTITLLVLLILYAVGIALGLAMVVELEQIIKKGRG